MATCNSADSVLDAASLIKSNGIKLNTFVNGESDQTVQLGESTDTPTPTLRNLVANALEHVAESMGDSVETAVATINELESGKADKVSGNVEDHIAALDMYGNLQDSRIDMGDVATISVDIANLDTDKADKVSGATNGHIATLNASGNLTDSGLAKADVQTKLSSFSENNIRTTNASGFAKDSGKAIADVQFKLSSATANNVLVATSSGFMQDSGIASSNVQQKLTGHTTNHLLSVNSSGFMQDSGVASSNVALKDTDIAELQTRKAGKVVPVEAGNLARLNASGDLRDAGMAASDLMPILTQAGFDARSVVHRLRTAIVDFDESAARHRLMQRLLGGTNPTSSTKPLLFVVSGQSNAVGSGNFPAFDQAEDCGWQYTRARPQLLPIKDPSSSTGGSQWPAFARTVFALTGRKVVLLNIAKGGSLVTSWGTQTENTWADDGYGTLRASAEAMWNDFVSLDVDCDLAAILWSQGESEAMGIEANITTAQAYASGTLDVIAWTRSLVGDSSIPVFNCMIGYQYTCFVNSNEQQRVKLKASYEQIQKAQKSIFNGSNGLYMASEMPPRFGYAWDEFMVNIIHYGPVGYKVVGEAFARSVVNQLNIS